MYGFFDGIKDTLKNNFEEFRECPLSWFCNLNTKTKVIGSIISVLTIIGMFAIIMNLPNESSEPLGYHVDRWLEQLPYEHELKVGNIPSDGFIDMMRLQSSLAIFSSTAFNAGTELFKKDLSVRFGLLGDLIAWRIDYELNQSEPIYSLFDAHTGLGIQYIELRQEQAVTLSLLRNQETIPLRFEERRMGSVAMHVARSFGFAMTYIQNPDIAVVDGDVVRAMNVGNTTLVIVYGANIFEVPITVIEYSQ